MIRMLLTDNHTHDQMPDDQGEGEDNPFLLIGGYLLVVVVLGTMGNVTVIYTFLRVKKLHSPTNLLIVNLSASDLLVATTGTPLSMISNFYGRWIFGSHTCAFYGFVNYYCGCISLNSLAAISVFRYIIVVRGNVQNQRLTLRSSVYAIGIIHLYTMIFSTPPLYGWNRFVLAGFHTGCDIDFHTKTPLFISYICYMFFFLFFLPLGLISWSYFKIYQRVSQHSDSMRRTFTHVAKETSSDEKRVWLEQMKNTKLLHQPVKLLRLKPKFKPRFHQRRTASTILITIAVFLISWLPYCIVSLWILIGDENSISQLSATIPSLFAKSSVMYNPLIYAVMNSRFRKALLKSLSSLKCLGRHELNQSN
ncbi:rhodopsin, GQ-coupled-like [Lytechinus variegatus]|uniref:rhodopsin, GQ-coupled-like n=1 Tax=Lytechinus variegatus TaxID=7654 RepID=UPI001BB1A4D1|nr:rhodopsin, GQ-coupled-like [Lytechinus variegatus]